MANNFTLTLDTTAPAGVDITLDGGAAVTITRDINAALSTSDSPTTGYQMKIWGDVDEAFDADVQADEVDSTWISFAATKAIRLSTGDGTKTVNVKIRDDVGNASSADSDTISLDTSAPVVNITDGPSATRISKIATFDTITVDWEVDVVFEEYKVKVVPATNSTHTAGVQIPTTAGSANVVGAAGGYPATTEITTTIKGADLESASAGDGAKIVKIFAKDASGNWSS